MREKKIPLSNKLVFFTTKLWEFLEINLGEKVECDIFDPIFNLHFIFKKYLNEDILTQYARAKENYKKNKDREMLIQEVTDIQDKMKTISECNDLKELREMIIPSPEIEEFRKIGEYKIYRAEKRGFEKALELVKAERILRRQETRFSRRIKCRTIKIKRTIKRIVNNTLTAFANFIQKIKNHWVLTIMAIISIIASFYSNAIKKMLEWLIE
ncbi:hypothetical protein BBW65_02440 [Helicobacter enhydrae]|uniref:Uncharacterized protein n=2 Tax=Helicobacter enhydrae TaxID=222136 RepID=A0A1B1U4V0_9HELI|nr:hypothetical protein BBW65_02440 [Helicobacter enhydrae]